MNNQTKKFPLKEFNPERCQRERHEYSGEVLITDLPRVLEVAASGKGELFVDMKFALEKGGVVIILLEIKGSVELICQRTLEPFMQEVVNEVELAAVQSEKQMEFLSSHYEPILMNEGWLDSKEIIEEEVLLALPVVAKSILSDCDLNHDQAYCSASKSQGDIAPVKENPFAVLAGLREKKN